MRCIIDAVDNGFMLTTDDNKTVYECEDDLNGLQALLRNIAEYLTPTEFNNRYSKERIYVEIRPGDKYDDIKQRADI